MLVFILSIALRGHHSSMVFDFNMVMSGQFQRLLLSQFIFTNTAQTLVGISLLYVCRQFERQLGSRKFGAFTFISFTLSMVLMMSMAAFTRSMEMNYTPSSGPYSYIFSLLVLFYAHVPKVSPSKYSVLGLPLSEKTWTYVFGAQLLFNEMERSAGPSIIGVLIGMLYLGDHFSMQAWRLPAPLEKLFSLVGAIFSIVMPAPPTNPPRAAAAAASGGGAGDGPARRTRSSNNSRGEQQQQQQQGDDAAFDRARTPSWADATRERLDTFGGMGEPIAPPSEEQIASITALGFERTRAVHALEQCENNVEAAANFLLR
jgi:hypothetical protein